MDWLQPFAARDFETCNYNLASINSIGMEVEELGLFDLQNEIAKAKAAASAIQIAAERRKETPSLPAGEEFVGRLSAY